MSEAEQARFQATLAQQGNEEVEEMVITWDESLAESEAKGQLKATREAIVLVLKHRLPAVPPKVVEQLEAIDDLSRLHDLLEKALEARSPDDLGLQHPPQTRCF